MDAAQPNGLEHCSDAELVRLLVAGNTDAMTVIFDRYYRLVMSVAMRMLRDVAEAEDVAQIVLAEFYRKAKLFDERKGNLGTWLLQYTYGRTINHKKGLSARRFYEHELLDNAQADLPVAGRTRVWNLDTREAIRLVEQILPSLNEKQRLVIERVFFEGKRICEVASETGESLGNTHHAYYRGIEKLRRCVCSARNSKATEEVSLKNRLFGNRKSREPAESLGGEVQIAKTRVL